MLPNCKLAMEARGEATRSTFFHVGRLWSSEAALVAAAGGEGRPWPGSVRGGLAGRSLGDFLLDAALVLKSWGHFDCTEEVVDWPEEALEYLDAAPEVACALTEEQRLLPGLQETPGWCKEERIEFLGRVRGSLGPLASGTTLEERLRSLALAMNARWGLPAAGGCDEGMAEAKGGAAPALLLHRAVAAGLGACPAAPLDLGKVAFAAAALLQFWGHPVEEEGFVEKVAAHPYVVDVRRFERWRQPHRDFALAEPALVEEAGKLLEVAAESGKLISVRSKNVFIERLLHSTGTLPPCRWRLLLAELSELIVGRTKPLLLNTAAPGVIVAGPGGRVVLWGQQEHPSWSIRRRRSRSRSPR